MAADDPVTLGEVKRSLDRLGTDTAARFDRLDRRIDQHHASFVHLDAYRAEQAHQDSRIKSLEEGNQWLRRTVLAAVIGAVVTLLIPMIALAVAVRGGG
jgi:hypothetical protein